jgi:hypothetical protein
VASVILAAASDISVAIPTDIPITPTILTINIILTIRTVDEHSVPQILAAGTASLRLPLGRIRTRRLKPRREFLLHQPTEFQWAVRMQRVAPDNVELTPGGRSCDGWTAV